MTRIDSPLARYARATAPDGWLTADGWRRLADDLDREAHYHRPGTSRGIDRSVMIPPLTPEQCEQRIARANDCIARAAALTRDAI